MPNMQERLETAIERTETDSSLFHNMVHGTDTQTVPTEGGDVPTMAKALKDVRDELYGQASSLVNLAQAAADDAANSVLLAQAEVQNAKAEVQNAKTEVQNAKQEVRNAQAEVVNAQTEVQNAAAEVVKAKAEVTKAEQEVQKAKDEVENAKAEVRNAQAEVVNAQTEVQNAAAEVVKAKAEVTKAQTEVQNAKAEVTKAQIWAEGTDAQVEAQGGIHSCQKWVELAQQATIGSFPVTVTGIATANQTVLPLNLEQAITSTDQILTVNIENTELLPENYGISNNGQSVVLVNPLAAGERWCVKCLFDLQSMAGMIDCVIYEEM